VIATASDKTALYRQLLSNAGLGKKEEKKNQVSSGERLSSSV